MQFYEDESSKKMLKFSGFKLLRDEDKIDNSTVLSYIFVAQNFDFS